jgi:hypothetical protein
MKASEQQTGLTTPGSFQQGLVTVVIPTYNRAGLVCEAVESVLAQTYSNFEVLVVDDGSTDDTRTRIESLNESDGRGRLRYERIEKGGAPAARNRGLELARGEFIQFLDSDDLLHREKFERQVIALQKKPELDMVYCLTELFENRPGELQATRWRFAEEPDLTAFVSWPLWDTNAPLWRRSAFDKAGRWQPELLAWQDYEYHIRAIAAGIQARGLPEVLCYAREHSRQRIDQPRPSVQKLQSFVRACQLVSEHLDRLGVKRGAAREALANRVRGIAMLCFEQGERAVARTALRLGLAQKPSPMRRAYMWMLLGFSHLRGGDRAALGAQKFCPGLGQFARRLRLLPRYETQAVLQGDVGPLRFLPRR